MTRLPIYVEPVDRRTSVRFRVSSGPGARSALKRVAARPREREPGARAGRRGSRRQQALVPDWQRVSPPRVG